VRKPCFIESLKANEVPQQIDRSVMPKLSGISQNQVISAFRFLGLTSGSKNESTEQLEKLRTAFGTDNWGPELAKVIETAYRPIVGDLDLAKATPKQLRDAFREKGGVDGQMHAKALRFYGKAIKEAGIKYASHLFARQPRGTGPKKPSGRNGQSAAPSAPQSATERMSKHLPAREEPPEGTIPFLLHFPGKLQGSIAVPADLKESDLPIVEAAIEMVKAYAKANTAN
jgi:hypothetical protein